MFYSAFSRLTFTLLSCFYCIFSISVGAQEIQDQKTKTLVITNSKAWKPFSYLDNGKPKGLLIDFWRLYGERSGTNIVFDLVDWQDSLDKTAQGHANVHAGLVYSDKRAQLFEFGSELFSVQTSVYIDINLMGIIDDDLSYLKQPVGVVQGGYEQDFVSKHYPNIPLIAYANNEVMFEAVSKQEISVFVADKQVANFYMVSFLERPDEFIAIKQLYDEPIRFAVTKGDFMLLRVIEGQLKMLTQSDIDQIKQKWINTETQVPLWFYNSVFFVLLLAAGAYIYSLRKAVAKRTIQLAIANKKLLLQANTDVLTGIYNRRFLMDYLAKKQQKSTKNGFAVLMLDIDFFKSINDNYGHPVGDIVLTILAKRIQSCVREKDIFSRIGGEEFCILLEEVTSDNMLLISEKLNDIIAASPFKHRQERIDISISIGALYIPKKQLWSSEQALQQADKLLYQAKAEGRDQTVGGFFN